MRQGWIAVPLAAALLCAVPAIGASHALAAPAKGTAAPSTAKKASLRQFTGWVTALDKSTITVEKRGKNPRSMTFVKHDEMRTTGEIEKDARVTVYYREEGGRAVAHRVVVKSEGAGATSGH